MQMTNCRFETVDWTEIERTEHKGETGLAYWQTRNFGDIRVRMVEYTPGYVADHWCTKSHILLKPGMSYQVGDNVDPHRTSTVVGAKLFLVD